MDTVRNIVYRWMLDSLFVDGDIQYAAYKIDNNSILVFVYVLWQQESFKNRRQKRTWPQVVGQEEEVEWGQFTCRSEAVEGEAPVRNKVSCKLRRWTGVRKKLWGWSTEDGDHITSVLTEGSTDEDFFCRSAQAGMIASGSGRRIKEREAELEQIQKNKYLFSVDLK